MGCGVVDGLVDQGAGDLDDLDVLVLASMGGPCVRLRLVGSAHDDADRAFDDHLFVESVSRPGGTRRVSSSTPALCTVSGPRCEELAELSSSVVEGVLGVGVEADRADDLARGGERQREGDVDSGPRCAGAEAGPAGALASDPEVTLKPSRTALIQGPSPKPCWATSILATKALVVTVNSARCGSVRLSSVLPALRDDSDRVVRDAGQHVRQRQPNGRSTDNPCRLSAKSPSSTCHCSGERRILCASSAGGSR